MNGVLEVQCPCCKSTLKVDQATGAVLSHKEAKREIPSLDSFLAGQKNRTETLEEKFKQAQEKEKSKLELIEKKFKQAQENKDLKDPPPSVMWD